MPQDDSDASVPDTSTGLPVLRTWRAVYVAVAAVFVLWVVLLTVLPRVFA